MNFTYIKLTVYGEVDKFNSECKILKVTEVIHI